MAAPEPELMVLHVEGLAGLRELVGQSLGVSDWLAVEQGRVDAFAEATGDRQWIHVDPERAAAGPFGGTIAHGYLTLALAPLLLKQIWELRGLRMSINYGLNRVRFPAPVPVGSRIRLRAILQALEEVRDGVQATVEMSFELEGSAKPACVAEALFRYLG